MPIKPNFQIPSELLEPHLRYFMMIQLESLLTGFETPESVRQNLKAVDYFISCSGGIHSRLATSNEFYRLINLDDNKMIEIAKSVFK